MTAKNAELKTNGAQIAYDGPQGQEQAVFISMGWLLNDPGREIRRQVAAKVREPLKVGLVWGAIMYGEEQSKPMYPRADGKPSLRWYGEIGFQKRDGTIGEAKIAYLPKTIESDLASARCPIIAEGAPPPPPFVAAFSVEAWLVPTTVEPGYGYKTFTRLGPRHNISALAPPEVQALLPKPQPSAAQLLGYDSDGVEVEAIEAPIERAEDEQDVLDHFAPDAAGLRDAAQ